MRWARHAALWGLGAELWSENLMEGDHLENPRVDRRIMLIWTFDLIQDRYWWRALVNAVANLRVPSSAGHFLTS
jgi:hypothetical protein